MGNNKPVTTAEPNSFHFYLTKDVAINLSMKFVLSENIMNF